MIIVLVLEFCYGLKLLFLVILTLLLVDKLFFLNAQNIYLELCIVVLPVHWKWSPDKPTNLAKNNKQKTDDNTEDFSNGQDANLWAITCLSHQKFLASIRANLITWGMNSFLILHGVFSST